jgi:hypothetical protein
MAAFNKTANGDLDEAGALIHGLSMILMGFAGGSTLSLVNGTGWEMIIGKTAISDRLQSVILPLIPRPPCA